MLKTDTITYSNSSIQWYAIVTRSRAEKKVNEKLVAYCETFLPLQKQWRQWSDRKKKVEIPLIPSFVFVKTTPKELINILKVEGVVRVLNFLGKPAIVREDEIATLKLLIENSSNAQVISSINLEEGEQVEIVKGPLAGLKATFICQQGKYKVIVNIETPATYFQVEVSANQLKKIGVAI